MGWKNSTILIRPAPECSVGTLLSSLGQVVRQDIGRHPYRISIGPGSIWVGLIGDCLVLESEFAPFLCEERAGSDEAYLREGAAFREALLLNCPDAEIVALLADSRTGSGGFAAYRNGILVRRWLAHDGDVVLNEGAVLPEENAALSRFKEAEYEGDLHEPSVFEIFRSLTGFEFNSREVRDTVGSRFWLNNDEQNQRYGRRR